MLIDYDVEVNSKIGIINKYTTNPELEYLNLNPKGRNVQTESRESITLNNVINLTISKFDNIKASTDKQDIQELERIKSLDNADKYFLIKELLRFQAWVVRKYIYKNINISLPKLGTFVFNHYKMIAINVTDKFKDIEDYDIHNLIKGEFKKHYDLQQEYKMLKKSSFNFTPLTGINLLNYNVDIKPTFIKYY